MLKIGSLLVNEEQVQLVRYDPVAPELDVYTSGQITTFNGPDIAEAWRVLQAETGFVMVGKSDGQFLVNTDLVELAYIVTLEGVPPSYVFRIQGRNYSFDDPGNFDFSALTASPAARSSQSSENAAAAPVSDWDEVKKNDE